MITSSAYVEDRRRDETGRPRMSADTYKAAKSNNVDYFQRLLGSSRSVDAVDVLVSITLSGKTVAHVAAIFNSKEVMEEVCTQMVALLTTADFMGATPLHEAAAHGHAEVVEVIVRCATGSSKLEEMLHMRIPGTAMDLAVVNNHLKVVEALANAEPRLICPSLLWPDEGDRQSVLDQASVRGHWEVVEFILAHMPLDPDRLQYSGGSTPLHRAIAQKRKDIAEKLISRVPGFTSMFDSKGNTPLHLACRHGLVETVRLLLQVNGDAVYRENNVNGRFPNHEAAIEGRIEVYRELVERFPDIEDLMDSNGENAFHMAIKENKFYMVQHILETTKNNNVLLALVKGSGSTALHIAAEKELIWIVYLLLDDERTVSQSTLYDKNLQIPADHIIQSKAEIILLDDERTVSQRTLHNNNLQIPADRIIQSKADNWPSVQIIYQKIAIWWALTTKTDKYSYSDRREFEEKLLGSSSTRKEGEKIWKSTSGILLLMDSLVATVSFAAIFTLPGGYEETTGLAKFRSKPYLQAFVMADAAAMFLAMLSALIIIMFDWAHYKGQQHVHLVLTTTFSAFWCMCLAFVLSLELTIKLSWAPQMVLVALLESVFGLAILILFMTAIHRQPPDQYYFRWRCYVLFRRAMKRAPCRAAPTSHLKLS